MAGLRLRLWQTKIYQVNKVVWQTWETLLCPDKISDCTSGSSFCIWRSLDQSVTGSQNLGSSFWGWKLHEVTLSLWWVTEAEGVSYYMTPILNTWIGYFLIYAWTWRAFSMSKAMRSTAPKTRRQMHDETTLTTYGWWCSPGLEFLLASPSAGF